MLFVLTALSITDAAFLALLGGDDGGTSTGLAGKMLQLGVLFMVLISTATYTANVRSN